MFSQHNGTEHSHKDITCSSNNCQSVTVNYTISNISPLMRYTFTIDILDYFNNSKMKNVSNFSEYIIFLMSCHITLITIATYHVQGLTLQYYSDNGSVVVECRFAERSTANGCHVIFTESSKGIINSINMTKSSIEESTVYQYITLPVSGNYTVTAHDIVDGTIITNPSVVYPQIVEYVSQPSPTKTVITTSKYSISLVYVLIDYRCYIK